MSLRKMNLMDLPKQAMNDPTPPISHPQDAHEGSTISGDLYDEAIDEGSLEEIHEYMDVSDAFCIRRYC